MITPALPHSSPPKPSPYIGAVSPNLPPADWVSRMFSMCLERKPAASAIYTAVREKTEMSPLQPIRSFRCGQSVGIDRKLPSVDQTIFCHKRFTKGLDVR